MCGCLPPETIVLFSCRFVCLGLAETPIISTILAYQPMVDETRARVRQDWILHRSCPAKRFALSS
jgi:hypothetical protein